MASKRELEALIVLAGRIDPSLRNAIKNAQKNVSDLSEETSFFGRVTDQAFSVATQAITAGAVGIGTAMVFLGKKGLDLASDLTEVQNVVDVTFGKGASQINDWSKTALKSYGLTELAAKQYTGTLGALMKSSGVSSSSLVSMSENLAALSGDFASFYNLKPEEAFEKIKSGISGETEPLKSLGINMSVANLEAYALSKGIKTSYDKMDQASQTILRYNFLLDKSKDAQGDFARTQGSYANQQRIFTANIEQLSAKIMSAALPAFNSLVKKGNQLIDAFSSDPIKIGDLQQRITSIAEKVITFIPIAVSNTLKFASVMGDVFNVAANVFSFMYNNWSLIGPLLLSIAAAMGAVKLATLAVTIYQGSLTVWVTTTKAWAAAQNLLTVAKMKDAAATLYLRALYLKDAIVKGASTVATWAMTAATTAWSVAATVATAVTTALGAAIAFITSPIGLVIIAIAALVAGIILLWKNWDQVSAWMVGLWQNYVMPFFQSIGAWFSGLWTSMVEGFKTAWSGITSWFSSLWEGVLSIFKGYLNLYISPINTLIDSLNNINFQVPDWVPGVGGKAISVNIPKIPTFAHGGFANQPSIFGEAGPEAAIPLKRTPRSLSLLNQTARAIGVDGGSGSPTFIFSPVISGNSSASIKQDIEDAGEDFFNKCDRWWESKRRESFGY